MNSTSRFFGSALVSAITLAAVFSLPSAPGAQKGGGGKGGPNIKSIVAPETRLTSLERAFVLTKEQKNAIKLLLDTAHKDAAPIREGLTRTHAAIAATVQGNKGQAEIEAATKAYAEQAAAMAGAEMKALAGVMKLLTDAQRGNSAGISAAFFNIRGAFIDNKKWDEIPESRVRY